MRAVYAVVKVQGTHSFQNTWNGHKVPIHSKICGTGTKYPFIEVKWNGYYEDTRLLEEYNLSLAASGCAGRGSGAPGLNDEEDLVRKGYGWLLKAASVKYPEKVYRYVMDRRDKMPRVALRYAIEKLPKQWQRQAMDKK